VIPVLFQKVVFPPQVILQYDNYGKVWALQPGYWTKISDNEFHILYEENLLDNSWVVIEENIFTKIK